MYVDNADPREIHLDRLQIIMEHDRLHVQMMQQAGLPAVTDFSTVARGGANGNGNGNGNPPRTFGGFNPGQVPVSDDRGVAQNIGSAAGQGAARGGGTTR